MGNERIVKCGPGSYSEISLLKGERNYFRRYRYQFRCKLKVLGPVHFRKMRPNSDDSPMFGKKRNSKHMFSHYLSQTGQDWNKTLSIDPTKYPKTAIYLGYVVVTKSHKTCGILVYFLKTDTISGSSDPLAPVTYHHYPRTKKSPFWNVLKFCCSMIAWIQYTVQYVVPVLYLRISSCSAVLQ